MATTNQNEILQDQIPGTGIGGSGQTMIGAGPLLSDSTNTPTPTASTTATNEVPLPSSTDLGQQALGLVDQAAGMEYVPGENEKKVNDLLTQIEGSTYESSYSNDIQNILDVLKNSSFSYNPETDPLFNQAKDVVSRQVMEEMAARNILPSTVTADRQTQALGELLPQYEAQAYARYQGTLQEKYNLFNALTQLDQTDYARYTDALGTKFSLAGYYNDLAKQDYQKYVDEVNGLYEQAALINNMNMQDIEVLGANLDRDFQERTFAFQQEQAKIENKRAEIADAWARVEQLGYADADSALILGIEPGTLSASAREAAQALENQLKVIEVNFQNQVRLMNKDYAQQRALVSQKQATEVKPNYSIPSDKVAANVKELKNIFARVRLSGTSALGYIAQNEQSLVSKYGSEAVETIKAEFGGGNAPTQETYVKTYNTLFSSNSAFQGDGELIASELIKNWSKYKNIVGEEGATQLLQAAYDLAKAQEPQKALNSAIQSLSGKSEADRAAYIKSHANTFKSSLGEDGYQTLLETFGIPDPTAK